MQILIVEDDEETALYLTQGLQEVGHAVSWSHDGENGKSQATDENWDLLIVDRMLPKLDDLRLIQCLRGGGVDTSVLFRTTLGGLDYRIDGLNAGADDCVFR